MRAISRKVISCILAAALMLGMCPAMSLYVAAEETESNIFYNRTFEEDIELGTSPERANGNGSTISLETEESGNKYAKIVKADNANDANFQVTLEKNPLSNVVIEIDLSYTGTLIPASLYYTNKDSNSDGLRKNANLIDITDDGKVTVGNNKTELTTLSKGQWTRFGFVINLDNNTADVYVNGTQAQTGVALASEGFSKLGFVRLATNGAATYKGCDLAFDNFRIYEGSALRDWDEDSLRVFYNRTYDEGKDIVCSISQVNVNGNTVVAKTVDNNTFVSIVKGTNTNNASFQANIDETVTNLVTEIDLTYFSDNVVPASLYFSDDSQAGWQNRTDTTLANVDADGKVTVKGQEIATLTKGQWVKFGFVIDLSTKTCTAVFVDGEQKATDISLGGTAQSKLGFMRVLASSDAADAGKEICFDNFRIYEGTEIRDLKGVNPSEMQDPVQSEEGPLWETFPKNYGSVDTTKIQNFTQSIMDNAIDSVPLVRFTDSKDSLYAGWTNLEKRSSTAMYYLTLSEYLNQGAKSSVTGKTAKDRALEHFRALIKGGNEPFACSGPYLSHAVVSSAIVLAKNTPSIWNSLTADEHERLDWLMKALAICGNWSFNDANDYKTGFDMEGNFDKNWNPNYRNTYLTAVGNACLYFGGTDQLNEIFTTFSYDTYVAKFTELGFTNILASWTTAGKDLMENGGAATLSNGGDGGNGAGVKAEFKFNGKGLNELTSIALEQFVATYDANVVSTAGKAGTSAYSYIIGNKTSPYDGYYGMMYEFVSGDAGGLRSSADYAYSSMINIVPYLLNLKMLGGWNSANNDDQLKLEKMMFVGHEDLIFKLENGYHSYMKGSGSDEYEQTLEVKGYAMIKDLWKKAFLYTTTATTISEDPAMVSYPSAAPKDNIAWAPEGASTSTYINGVTAEDYIKLNANGSSNFTVEWDINFDTDVASTFDGVIAFTQDRNVPAAYSGFNALIQMKNGTFNIYNSSAYVNSEAVVWGNYKYHVRVAFDVTAGTYSVYVGQTYPDTAAEVCIAENYAFRATAGTPTAIEYMLLVRQNGDADYWIENLSVDTDGDEDDTHKIAITFQASGGTAVGTQYVNAGEKVTKPEDPTRTGYDFEGWYSDAELSQRWDFENGTVSADMTLYANWTLNASDTGYTAAIAASSDADVNNTVHVTVKVASTEHQNFASSELKLSYDAEKLAFDENNSTLNGATVKAENGVLTLEDYGEAQELGNAYVLAFTAKAEGNAVVTLTSAMFSTQEHAAADDLISSTRTTPTATVKITLTHNVTLPEYFTGAATVADGEDYTFTAKDTNLYDYTNVAATVGGETAEVIANGDASYTVKNVTGDLVITAARTGKTFTVTIAGSGKDDLTDAADKATYGTDYSFTVPTSVGDTYNVTISYSNGTNVPYTTADGKVTIAGKDITGDFTITVTKTVVQPTTATVRVEGNAASDVTLTNSGVATPGTDYTFTVTMDERYDYTITVKNGETDVELTKSEEGSYTISGKDFEAGDTIVITANKFLKTEGVVEVKDYLTLNETTMWLILAKTGRIENGSYTYQNSKMFWSEKYGAYCYLVIAAEKPTVSAEDLAIINESATAIDYGMDVNMSGKINANDAQLVYNMYNVHYSEFTDDVTMEKFLRADVNFDCTVNVSDATAIITDILN